MQLDIYGNVYGIMLTPFDSRCTQEDQHPFGPQCLHGSLDFFLTFQVKGAGGGSNETVGHLQHDLRAGTAGAVGDGCPLNAVPLAQGYNAFTFKFHWHSPEVKKLVDDSLDSRAGGNDGWPLGATYEHENRLFSWE